MNDLYNFRNENDLSVQYRSSSTTSSKRSSKRRSRPVISIIIDSSSSEDEENTEHGQNLTIDNREPNNNQPDSFNEDLEDLFGGILDQVQSMFGSFSEDGADDESVASSRNTDTAMEELFHDLEHEMCHYQTHMPHCY